MYIYIHIYHTRKHAQTYMSTPRGDWNFYICVYAWDTHLEGTRNLVPAGQCVLDPHQTTDILHSFHELLQCVAVCCSVLQCVVVCCSVLQCVAVCCFSTYDRVSRGRSVGIRRVLEHKTKKHVKAQLTATHCNTLQHTATHCNTLQHTAAHCNTLHKLCSVLQCVVVWCGCKLADTRLQVTNQKEKNPKKISQDRDLR